MSEKADGFLEKPQPGFFSWIGPAFKSRRTMKTWFRCCVALTATLVLMVDKKTSLNMGQASFFAAIVCVMLPPSLPLSLFVLAALALMIGMLIGWAWGAAAMAASASVRSQALIVQQQRKLQSSLVAGISPALQIQKGIFSGFFLDPRSSAVYGVFFFIGTFSMGVLRAFIPNLALLSVFGCIVLDIICTYGPSLPTPQYTLAKVFLIPTTYYVAIAIACLVFIFPESLNHVWLTILERDFFAPTLELLSLQNEALNSRPSDRATWARATARANGFREALIRGTQSLLSQIGTIDLEFSIGRLGPKDLKKVNAELKSLMFRAAGLHSFQVLVNDINLGDEKEEKEVEARARRGDQTPRTVDRFATLRRQIQEREARHGNDLDTLIPILSSSSENLRSACESATRATMDWFKACNTGRWAAFFTKLDQTHVEARSAGLKEQRRLVETALNDFRNLHRIKLLKPYERFFDPVTKKLIHELNSPEMFSARSLFICFVFTEALEAFAEHLVKVLKCVVDLDTQRPKPRLWMPGSLNQVAHKIRGTKVEGAQGVIAMGTTSDPTTFEDSDAQEESDSDDEVEQQPEKQQEPEKKQEPKENRNENEIRRNPDALPPTTVFGRFFVQLGSFFRFFKSAEGIFALRLAIVSVALWIPSVCHTSAWLYYENRGLWALIMAQTGLGLYVGDQIADFLARITGTVLGLLLGMVAWYIAAGRGHGNPYGVVIASVVFIAPFLLGRIAAPRAQSSLWAITGVTVVFVTGYSWINANQVLVANTGVGVYLGWKRALLVIIGFTAAFVVMLFPFPVSTRVLVRKTFGATAAEIGKLFAGEVETFLTEEAKARTANVEKTEFTDKKVEDESECTKEKRVRVIAKRVIDVLERLEKVAPSLRTAKFEPQLQGSWPQEQYQMLYNVQTRALTALVILITAFSKLDNKWCRILVNRTPFLNPNFLSDVFSVLSVLSGALTNAHPLPAFMPKLRERLIFYERHSGMKTLAMGTFAEKVPHAADKDSEASTSEDDTLEFTAGRVDGSTIGFEELSLDVLLDDQLAVHSTAVVALSSLVSRLDEMADIVRSLCGEATFRGFDNLQRDYLEREERTLGTGFSVKMQ